MYDIGKTPRHDYRATFAGHTYLTVDADPETQPDVVMNVESGVVIPADDVPRALVCNGVTEQCNDVAALLRGCRAILRDGGAALFGIISVGYPLYQEHDRCRLTPHGVKHYLEAAGFSVEQTHMVHRGKSPSYVFAWCWC